MIVKAIRAILRNRIRIALLAVIVAAAGSGGLLWYRFWRPPPPLEVALWYWHSPFTVTASDAEQLKIIGVRRLFVRAGTFHIDGAGVRLTQPQTWASRADGVDIHLVFNFDASVLRAFPAVPVESLAIAVLREFQRVRADAERSGLRVAGVQLDLDCPTSRLSKYADLLHRIHAGLTPRTTVLSITALPTWYRSGNLARVLAEIDFAAPQYYEANVGASRSEYATVSQLRNTEDGLASAGWRGAPFFAGIPAYGHALVYSGSGRLVGAFHDMGLTEAIRSRKFRLERAFGADEHGQPATKSNYSGEDVYELRAMVSADGARDQPTGYHVVYEIPTPTLIARQVAVLRARRPSSCLGMILFRYPEPAESSTVPLSAISALLQGRPATPQLQVRMKCNLAPWESIDSAAQSPLSPVDVTVSVTNVGSSSAFVGADAVSVTLTLNRAAIEDISSAGSDSIETLFQQDNASASDPPIRASMSRANIIRIGRISLAAGETQVLGTLRLRAEAGANVGGNWTARCPGGFDSVSGVIAPVALLR